MICKLTKAKNYGQIVRNKLHKTGIYEYPVLCHVLAEKNNDENKIINHYIGDHKVIYTAHEICPKVNSHYES